MCALLLVFAWLYISPTQLSKLGQQVCASVLFLSNFLFLHEAGYFDSASHQKLLLHTWSLSVEWQFYLLYPLWLVWLLRSGGAGKAARAHTCGVAQLSIP